MRLILALLLMLAAPAPATGVDAAVPEIRRTFADWMLDQRVPGLVWGIVADGRLVHVEAAGVQDLARRRPVTADSAFRIASMTKAFTAHAILQLAAEGRLSLEDKAVVHVPELAGWADAVRVRDLLHHTAGFVTDDPWGDRQQAMPEAEFTALLKAGVPMNRPVAAVHEYANLGYAILGRIVTRVAGEPYQQHIARTLFAPLGMTATTFEVRDVPDARLARGYRFEGGRHVPEPVMGDGAFGAMGGLVTTANDYAKWLAYLLDGLARAERTVPRAMAEGSGFLVRRPRPGRDAPACEHALIYAGGLRAGDDCLHGPFLFHSGGYPGYGSHMVLFPEAGIALFAFANRTYAAPVAPVWEAAGALRRAGLMAPQALAVSAPLAEGYRAAIAAWNAGRIDADPKALAGNMLLDRSADLWRQDFAQLKQQLGACDTSAPIRATGALSGSFQWRCTFGRLNGQILLAPTPRPQLQALRLSLAG